MPANPVATASPVSHRGIAAAASPRVRFEIKTPQPLSAGATIPE
jgi:hypothetical protein